MALSKSAAKRLGLETAEQLQNAFDKSGSVSVAEYKMFWGSVESEPKETTTFLFEVLKKMIVLLEEREAPGALPGLHNALLETLMNTIHFIANFMPMASDGRVGRALKKWAADDAEKNLSRSFPAVKDVVKWVGLLQDNKQDPLGTTIAACSSLILSDDYRQLSEPKDYPTIDDSLFKDVNHGFHYSYFKQLAVAETMTRESIVVGIFNRMLSLPLQFKVSVKMARTSLMALCHMLKQTLAIAPFTKSDILLRGLGIVRQFHYWPQPCGKVARATMQTLQSEMMAPGTTMLEYVMGEAYTVEHGALVLDGVKTRAVHYLLSGDSTVARQMARVMDIRPPSVMEKQRRASLSNKAKKVAVNTVHPTMQAMLLLNLLFANLGEEAVGDEEVEKVGNLSESQVATLFAQADAAMREALGCRIPDQAATKRARAFLALKEELERLSTAGAGGGKPVVLPAELLPPYIPRLPPLCHVQADTSIQYTFDTKEILKMMCLEYMTYPSTAAYEELDSILSGYASAPKPCEVRLVVAGDDQLTHSFLCAYMRVLQSSPQWLHGITVKLFLLPWGKNHIASFMARHDPWYLRHIYQPFRTPLLLVPWLKPEPLDAPGGGGYTKTEDPVNKPGSMLRELVSNYLREATATCDIVVYQIEGWHDDNKSSGGGNEKDRKLEALPDQKIPFCQRIVIGQPAEAEALRQKKQLPADVTLEDIYARKDFSFEAPEVDFTFTKIDLAGNKMKAITEEGIAFTSILLSNVPHTGDPCWPPNPLKPSMEMVVNPAATKTPLKRSVLIADPRQRVASVDMTCNSNKDRFTVLVDGQVFGPYHHIKISRATITRLIDSTATSSTAAASLPSSAPASSPTASSLPNSPPSLVNATSTSNVATTEDVPFVLSFQTFFPMEV